MPGRAGACSSRSGTRRRGANGVAVGSGAMEAGEGAKLHGYGYTAGYSWIVHRKSWLHEFHRFGFTVSCFEICNPRPLHHMK